MEFDTKNIFKNTKYYLRFELENLEFYNRRIGKNNEYFKQIHYRAKELFHSVFDKDDDILFICRSYSYYEGDKHFPLPRFKRFLRNKKHINRLKIESFIFKEFDDEDEYMVHQFMLPVKKDELKVSYLIDCMMYSRMIFKPNISGDVYFINFTKGIVYHMYDERGCDIGTIDKETILSFYHKHRKWIYDPYRIEFDHKLGQGLFGYSETEEEKKQRKEKDKKKIKEMGINLFYDNTCKITHELIFKKENSKQAIEEISQTGFHLEVGEKDDNVICHLIKTEALALIDYQSELMSLYAKKYNGIYNHWSAKKIKKVEE